MTTIKLDLVVVVDFCSSSIVNAFLNLALYMKKMLEQHRQPPWSSSLPIFSVDASFLQPSRSTTYVLSGLEIAAHTFRGINPLQSEGYVAPKDG